MDMIAFDPLIEKPLRLMKTLLRDVDKVALLDYPEYANVGDSMIWLGQVELLKRLGKKIVYVCAISNFDELELTAAVKQGAALLISGGGNFGTLWPHHQAFRERILSTFPAARIVQMPQSICFEDDAALERMRLIIARCKNFHLLVRDYPSFSLARQHFPAPVTLCPDSAFFIEGLRAKSAEHDIVYLRRSDKEAIAVQDAAEMASLKVTDWRAEWWSERWLQRLLRVAVRWRVLRNSQRVTIALYHALAWLRTQRGVQIVASGRQIITDRLHAHVLCVLLHKPNYILDNKNGKVFAFYDAWTRDVSSTRRVASLSEAVQQALARTAALLLLGAALPMNAAVHAERTLAMLGGA